MVFGKAFVIFDRFLRTSGDVSALRRGLFGIIFFSRFLSKS